MSTLVHAIQMEVDGRDYYLQQAARNQENSLHRVFQILAKAENNHADLLRSLSGSTEQVDYDDEVSTHIVNLFASLKDFKDEAASMPDLLAVYQEALAMEQKSIDLYQGMRQAATSEQEQQLLAFLVEQERKHHALFESLVTVLKNSREQNLDVQVHPLTSTDEKFFETLVDREQVMINHAVVPVGGGFDAHHTDSNVYIQVLRGKITLTFADGRIAGFTGGQVIEIPYQTLMKIDNLETVPLEILVIKAPNPKTMTV
jgi:rubrerythrin